MGKFDDVDVDVDAGLVLTDSAGLPDAILAIGADVRRGAKGFKLVAVGDVVDGRKTAVIRIYR